MNLEPMNYEAEWLASVLARAAPEDPYTTRGDADCGYLSCIGCNAGDNENKHYDDCWWVMARAALDECAPQAR